MRSPRFEFLGTGTSSGVPAIGCRCRVCISEDPRDRRLRTSAAITIPAGPDGSEPGERVIVIDTGPDFRQQALRSRLSRLDAILFTHNHVDHTWGLDEVRRFNAVMDQPIDIYASEHTHGFLRRVYQHIFDRGANVNDSFVASLIPRIARPLEPFDLFGLRITPIPLLHGRLPVLGYRFDPPRGGSLASDTPTQQGVTASDPESPFPLAFCTDVSAIPPESWTLLRGLKTLVLDALRLRKHPTHFSLDEAITVAQRVGAQRTFFIHMAHEIHHAEVEGELPAGMSLAYDTLSLGARPAEPG